MDISKKKKIIIYNKMIKDASIFYDRNSEVTEGIFILFYFLFKNKTKKKTKPETM